MTTTKYPPKGGLLRISTLSLTIEQIVFPTLFLSVEKVIITTLFLCISIVFPLKAQSLDDYLQLALENNPSIEAAYQEYLAIQEQPEQVALSNPALGASYFIRPVETRLGAQHARFSVSQQFPWFGALKAERTVRQQQAHVQEYQWVLQQLNLIYQVKEAYFRLYDVEKNIDILRQTLMLLQTYERLATQQYENGLARMVDILQAQMEIRKTETLLAIRQEEKQPLLIRFNSLLNRTPNAAVVLPDTLTISPESEIMSLLDRDSAWARYPDYQAVVAQQDVLEAQGEVARLSGKPMFSIGLEYMAIAPRTDMEMPNNGQDALMSMATISLPLWRKKYTAAQQEVLFRQQATQATAQQLINELTTKWNQALQERLSARREVQLYQAQTEQTQQALRILESAYSTEGVDFTDILDFQQQLLDYQMKLIGAVVRYHIAQAQLDKLLSNTP